MDDDTLFEEELADRIEAARETPLYNPGGYIILDDGNLKGELYTELLVSDQYTSLFQEVNDHVHLTDLVLYKMLRCLKESGKLSQLKQQFGDF